MLNFFIGLISGLISFAISRQIIHPSNEQIVDVNSILYSLILGLNFAAASAINGHNRKMFIISKIDFIVNVAVAAVVGALLASIILYFTKYILIGRWVFTLSILIYIAITIGVSTFIGRMRPGLIYIVGDKAKLFSEIVEITGNPTLHNVYKCIQSDLNIQALIDRFSINQVHSSIFYVPKRNEFCDVVLKGSGIVESILDQVFTIDQIIENELRVINPYTIESQSLWQTSASLRSEKLSRIKRMFDILIVIIMSPLACPIVLLVVTMNKLLYGGSVFYCQTRSGQFGKPFTIYKIRSMRIDSETMGAEWAKIGDARVTPMGRYLRKTRIDELPQLWNILRGDMSIVGPRPERPEFYKLLEKQLPGFSLRLICKPGLTGWAQVNYHYGASVLDSKVKMMYDLYYLKNATFILDCRIIMRTFMAMFKGAR